MSPITVYTKPACVQCNATVKAFDKAGISYEKIDVHEHPEARDYVLSLGYLSPPSGYVSPTVHCVFFCPDRVADLAAKPQPATRKDSSHVHRRRARARS